MPRKLGRVKVPTPEKALPPEAKPGGLFKMFDPQKLALQTLKLTRTLVVTLATYAYKTPYWTWYYATHAKERSEMITRLKDMARHEAQHYWNGTKLLVADVRTARTLLRKTLDGNALTRRERKQLLRTVSDLFRLVPFSMFVIIPFMEFALPFALRIFPNLLPSTFQDSLKAEETMKRELQSRIAMAQFFQDTLETLAKEQKKKAVRRRQEMEQAGDDPADVDSMIHKQEDSAASMLEFLSKARNGEMIPPDVIIRYAKYFQDDLTLDNMPRMQLINMCRYMNIPPYGADSFLRFQLRHRIRSLKEDDQRILWEGIESLTKMELREAVQERGMRSTGLSKDAYKRALQQWLDLSVNKNVPIALLIMSRTFFLQDEIPPMPPPPQAAKESAKGETDAKAASKTSAPAKEPKKTEDKAHTAETKDSSVTTDTEGTAKSDAALTGLADAISGLDKQVLNEVILNLATSEEKISDPEIRKLKLEVLQKQNELIQREEQDREEAKKQKAMSASESSEAASTDSTVSETTTPPSASPEPQPAETPLQALDGTLTTEEMDALRAILTDDPVSTEREALERIKSSMKEDISPDQREEQHGRSESREGHAKVASDGTPVGKEDTLQGAVAEGKKSSAPMTPAEADSYVSEQIREQERAAASMSDSSAATEFSTQSEKPGETARTAVDTEEKEEEAEDSEPDDPIVARLKKRIESMVDKIELQLTETEVKIGDKMHFLDKDRDGILSREEVAEVLQQVFKKNLSFDEAMEIASEIVSVTRLHGANGSLDKFLTPDLFWTFSFLYHTG